jgi:hypothetical protein
VILRAREFVDQYLIKHEFVKRLHARFNQEGIVIPFPIRTLALRIGDAGERQSAGVRHEPNDVLRSATTRIEKRDVRYLGFQVLAHDGVRSDTCSRHKCERRQKSDESLAGCGYLRPPVRSRSHW